MHFSERPESHVQQAATSQERTCGRRVADHEPLLNSFSLLSGRIGIFGGTFDPPHTGHLAIARLAMQTLRLDAVVFIPTQQNPLKDSAPRATGKDRLGMLSEMLKSEPNFYVSPLEVFRAGAVYTVDTLLEIHTELNPKTSLFLIVGSDISEYLEKWKDAKRIPELATIAAFHRGGYPKSVLPPSFPSQNLQDEQLPTIEVSSTQLRQALAAGIMPEQLPAVVQNYITKHNLYSSGR